jgi:hypothetical protein
LNIEFDASCIYDYLEISESGIYWKTLTFLKELNEVFWWWVKPLALLLCYISILINKDC